MKSRKDEILAVLELKTQGMTAAAVAKELSIDRSNK